MERDCRLATATLLAFAFVLSSAPASAGLYRAYPVPVASPDHGPRLMLVNPEDPVASPYGWHDTNGAPGAEFATLQGNNVHVYLDVDGNNIPDGPGPNGGTGPLFEAPFDPASAPSAYHAALAINAFHWYNRLHDIFYRHGFTPARGNMQSNNYGQGGLGNDYLRVGIANGTGTNNLVPTPTADGISPRISHYVWNSTTPNREASFDGTAMTWGFASVMYPRLNPTCSAQAESPHVGYSDFFATLLTNNFAATVPSTPRGMATYLMGQPITGAGLRTVPYSVDLTVNPRTYANLPTLSSPFATGTVWASAMWDATWAMVQRYGASNNLLTGFGGENRMLRLGIEAIAAQSCPVGFVTARNAVLARDLSLYGGDGRCTLWSAFARRGLGVGASQGSPTALTDGVANFDLPPDCADQIFGSGLQ